MLEFDKGIEWGYISSPFSANLEALIVNFEQSELEIAKPIEVE